MTELTTTLNELKAHDPCKDSWEAGLEYCSQHNIGLDDPISFTLLHKVLGDEDLVWATCVLNKKQRVYMGAKIAQQVVHLADDKRVQGYLDVYFKYAKGEATDDDLENSASDAACAAYYADDASYASYAAYTAASYAAYRADYAAAYTDSWSKSAQIVLEFCKTGEIK